MKIKMISWLMMGLGCVSLFIATFSLGYQSGSFGHFFFIPLILFWISFYLIIILHELGHAFMGYLTGYEFVALGVGPLHIVRENGQWHLRKKQLVIGAAAQYVGRKKDWSDKRAIGMSSGGLLVHAGLVLGLTLLYIMNRDWAWCLPYLFLNLALFLFNAAPRGITDGAKIWELYTHPDHIKQLYPALEHAAILYAAPGTAKVADFYKDDLAFEPGHIYQSYILNRVELAIFAKDYDRAISEGERLRRLTENSMVQMYASYLLFEVYLLSGDEEAVRNLARDKYVKRMLAQPQASIQVIKAKYELEILEKVKKAQKSLARAKKAFRFNQLLVDEKAFYHKINQELEEQLNRSREL